LTIHKTHEKYDSVKGSFAYPIMDKDGKILPPESPIFEFLHNEEITADSWERVNEWVWEQFQTNAPKEDTGHDLGQ
jgi:hypothetical protein